MDSLIDYYETTALLIDVHHATENAAYFEDSTRIYRVVPQDDSRINALAFCGFAITE